MPLYITRTGVRDIFCPTKWSVIRYVNFKAFLIILYNFLLDELGKLMHIFHFRIWNLGTRNQVYNCSDLYEVRTMKWELTRFRDFIMWPRVKYLSLLENYIPNIKIKEIYSWSILWYPFTHCWECKHIIWYNQSKHVSNDTHFDTICSSSIT